MKSKILNLTVGLPLGIVLFVVFTIIVVSLLNSHIRLLYEVMDSKDWLLTGLNISLSLSFCAYFFKQAKLGLREYSFFEVVLLPLVVLVFYSFSFFPMQDKYETEIKFCLLEEKIYRAMSLKCSRITGSNFFIKLKKSYASLEHHEDKAQ